MGNKKIDQVDGFTGSIISKDGGSSKDFKSRKIKARGVFFFFFKLKKSGIMEGQLQECTAGPTQGH